MAQQNSHSTCLTQTQMLDYLHKRLGPEQQHDVEAHALDCAFCREALEGLEAMANPAEIPLVVHQVHQQLRRELERHRHGSKQRTYYVWISALVLAVLMLLLVAFWALHYSLQKDRQANRPATPRTTLEVPANGAPTLRWWA